MEFKKLIFKIIDNKIDTFKKLDHLNKQKLKTLYNALKLNNSLKIIKLNCNNLKDITLLCKSLQNNSCLEKLDLSNNDIEDITPLKFL